jgi:protein-S-isoprenylcysteine O-methyltransferase Ste14
MVTVEAGVVTVFPVIFLVLLFGGGALFRRKNIDMDGKPPINKVLFYASKYSIVIVWGAMVLESWGVSIALVEVPGVMVWISLVLWISGFLLLFLGRVELGSSFRLGTPREETSLKVSGLYRFSRNPMYLGVYATVFASIIYTVNPVVIVVGVFVVAVHHKIILAEEEYMQKVFGQEYLEYSRRVRRYL